MSTETIEITKAEFNRVLDKLARRYNDPKYTPSTMLTKGELEVLRNYQPSDPKEQANWDRIIDADIQWCWYNNVGNCKLPVFLALLGRLGKC